MKRHRGAVIGGFGPVVTRGLLVFCTSFALLAGIGSTSLPSGQLLGSRTSYVKVTRGSEPGQIVVNMGGGGETVKGGKSNSSSSRSVSLGSPGGAWTGGAVQSTPVNPCVLDTAAQKDPFGSDLLGLAAAEVVSRYLSNVVGICKSGRGRKANLLTPSEVADSEWSTQLIKQLPIPLPTIPPGYGVVGITSYLLTGDVTHCSLSSSTPLGELTISAKSSFEVSFDGGDQYSGPFETSGAPWPIGGIDHMWLNPGTHSVVVLQNWTGNWFLDGQSGELPTLQTRGDIANYLVLGLVALRTS